jgi:hypothetical protein
MAATTEPSEERSPTATKRLARLAGIVYLALAVATAFGFYHAPLVQGDLGVIGRMLIKSDLRFHIAVVADVIAAALSVPLALLLYELFRPINRVKSALMALLLLVATPISFVVALNYVAAQWLLSGSVLVAAIPDPQRQALGMLFLGLHSHGVLAVEIFWGLWLFPFGLLVIRSRYLPRVLGVLLIIGGLAYVAHSVTSLLLAGQRMAVYERITMLARAAAEFPAILWLVIKGADARGDVPRPNQSLESTAGRCDDQI